jgi:hypothetical protein
MQVAESIYNRKYFISTVIRLEKVLFKNKRFKVTAFFSDFNNHRPLSFNKLKKKSNYFISFRRSVMASINDNRYIYSNISGRP